MAGTEAAEEAAVALLSAAVRSGASARLEIRGACMAPLLRPGDQVGVGDSAPLPGRLAVGRTATGELVCHRVVRRTARGCVLAGDRSATGEELPAASVVGVVSWIERDGRRLRFKGAAGRALDRALALRVDGGLQRPWEALRRGLLQLRSLAWLWFATEP